MDREISTNHTEKIVNASSPNWVVTAVEPKDNYILFVTFITGEQKLYDCKPLLDKGVFKQLREPKIFNLAHVDAETVVWNDELDIAPEELYDAGVAA